ncbi:MAG: IS3 family transposase [Clostridium sp.]|uniref:IS3 family transposase n=1 Tax=Clostridium sp. TaxID=1506 RepID=UPI003F30226A
MLQVYNQSKNVFGYRLIKVALKRQFNIIINHKKVKRLMKVLSIQSVIRRKKFKYNTVKILDLGTVEENLLNRDFHASKLNEKWVTDITYLYYGKNREKAYLSAVMDLYNNEIIAYKLSSSLKIDFVKDTFNDAFCKQKGSDLSNLIVHSDQGGHYKSLQYKKIVKKNKAKLSMSRKGNCYDNACIENFFGHLKSELIYQNFFENKNELFNAIDNYIYWYNNSRFQSVLKNRTPTEVRRAA